MNPFDELEARIEALEAARCPGRSCPRCNPKPAVIYALTDEPLARECPDCGHTQREHAIHGCHRCRCDVGFYDFKNPSVVGHDGRAEGNTASTVGPPQDAPAAEDEKPGESASPILNDLFVSLMEGTK